MSTFAIGDVHGHALLLDRLLARLPIQWGKDEVVLHGDLADRGPASQQVVATMMAPCAVRYPQVTVLRGNHEEMLLQALVSESAFHQRLTLGGDATYRAYCPPTRRMRGSVCAFAAARGSRFPGSGCRIGIGNSDANYVHAGAKRDEAGRWVLVDQQAALWSRDPAFFQHMIGPLLVVGHTPTKAPGSLLTRLSWKVHRKPGSASS